VISPPASPLASRRGAGGTPASARSSLVTDFPHTGRSMTNDERLSLLAGGDGGALSAAAQSAIERAKTRVASGAQTSVIATIQISV